MAVTDYRQYTADANTAQSCMTVSSANQLSTTGYVQITTGSSANIYGNGWYIGDYPSTNQQWNPPQQLGYYPYTPPSQISPDPEISRQLSQVISELKSKNQQEKPLNTRGLFEAFAVCIKDDDVYTAIVAAKDESAARLKAFKVLDLDDPDDFTFIVRRVGDLPARKEVQKVKIVKDSE